MKIPVNPQFVSPEPDPLDDSVVYEVMCTKFSLNGELDRNGQEFFKSVYKVIGPEEWQDRVVTDNYIPAAKEITMGMPRWEQRKLKDENSRFWRAVGCFTPLNVVKEKGEEFDTDTLIGATGKLTISNDEFNGMIIPKVRKYLPKM